MAAGYIIAIIVLVVVALGLGGGLAYVVVQRDNDEDPKAPEVVSPDLVAAVKGAMAKPKKAASMFGKHASEEEGFKKGRFLYSAVALTPPSSIEPILIGPVPASQSPKQSNFRSHVAVPENEIHDRLWLHAAS